MNTVFNVDYDMVLLAPSFTYSVHNKGIIPYFYTQCVHKKDIIYH